MKTKLTYLRGLLAAIVMCFTMSMTAQTTFKGTVEDEHGEPLIGATVQEKGKPANGTATDIEGNFTLQVYSPKATLVVSYVGMDTQNFQLNGKTDV